MLFTQLVIIILLFILLKKEKYFPIRYDPNLYPSEIVSPMYVNLIV